MTGHVPDPGVGRRIRERWPLLAAYIHVRRPPRAVHCVVTEHGIAQLFGKSLRERAAALIKIAAPEHRDMLSRAAKERCLL